MCYYVINIHVTKFPFITDISRFEVFGIHIELCDKDMVYSTVTSGMSAFTQPSIL